MASVPVYCLCRLPYDVTRFMIECDICQDWFHGSCVGVEEDKAAEIDLYHCPNCQVTHGPSVSSAVRKRRGGTKQADAAATGGRDTSGQPVKTGTPQFVSELRSRTFPSADEVLLKPSGAQLTVEFLEERSFSVPVMVLRRDGLGMSLPPGNFGVNDVEHYIGPDRVIDVIDVSRQADLKMCLGDFVEYYNSPNRDRVLNVISLEFSETRLSNLVETPKIVRKLSWVENLWPEESVFERPNVQKYCLMGVKDSYTDFHIDFGGTSVWYHVLRGEKIFYLISPTPANLALFEHWSSSSNQNEMFFGDQVDMCYKCSVKQGNTLFIPTGWIHAVLTPVDCVAFGGNFLHSLNIDMQLRAYEIEKRLSTADLFRFPNFETVCWYVGKHLLDTFRGLRENRRHPASYLVHGAKALNNAFRMWTRKESLTDHEVEIPETIETQRLVKDLAKEIRLVEDIFQQGRPAAPFTSTQGFPTPLPKASPLAVSQSPSRPPGRKRGPKPKDMSPSPKKKGQKGLMKEAGELDLLEIHTKHTLKKFQCGNKKNKKKLELPQEFAGKMSKSKLKLVLTNGKIQGKKGGRSGISNSAGRASQFQHHAMGGSTLSDFESEDELQIDETPPPRRKAGGSSKKKLSGLPRKLPRAKPCSDPHRIREPGEVDFDIEEDYTTDEEETMTVHGVKGGAGGILDLLKASKQVAGLDSALSEEAPASPSTREAIQGMLSMANPPSSSSSSLSSSSSSPLSVSGGLSEGLGLVKEKGGRAVWVTGDNKSRTGSASKEKTTFQRPGKRPVKRPVRHLSDEESTDEQETLGTCFKDAEYVYPSLESDEEDQVKRKRNWGDTPWSPKARVTPTLPKQERPVRDGARVASVETGLAAAAAKLAQQEIQKPTKRKYTKKPRPVAPPQPPRAEPSPPSPPPAPEPPTPDFSPERRMECYSASLLDHEYTAGPGPFGPGGPRGSAAMAPGVFLTSRRPSLSPQNSSTYSYQAASPAGLASPGSAGAGGGKRPKKGLATAKQRLGKILKIHRNGKLLL